MADDFDAAMAIIDPDMLENSTEMLSHANSVIENLLSAKKLWTASLSFAPKFACQNQD